MARFRAAHGARQAPGRDALLLPTLERTWDAVADGEVAALGLSVVRTIETALAQHLTEAVRKTSPGVSGLGAGGLLPSSPSQPRRKG
jgi:methylmalonyl-CoA mutase cobalamin-binding subunit